MKKLLYIIVFILLQINSFAQNTTRLEEKATEALSFCKANGYNTDFCVLIDMKIHSGNYRMFIYDFANQKVERKALCAHGCGKGEKLSTGEQPLFSNTEGSLLTSLGKYKIGIRSYSQWGINVHYKLHGLEASNSNAFKRIVVLHSHTPMPAEEISPTHLPMGWSFGCPVTDDATMTYLDAKLKKAEKPVLLWIYY
ncbi:MAG: murein L,D-transpeptidase catalytic domain family protein [Bacteroidetes bacterium]|nr:murein L,D-transpeptidase catalytic domain family protein [Bacteroidota bacterium]